MPDQEQTERGASTVCGDCGFDLPYHAPECRSPELAKDKAAWLTGYHARDREIASLRADLERVAGERDKALAEAESSMDAWFTHERICSDGNHVAAHIKDVLAERWSLMAERDAMREVCEAARVYRKNTLAYEDDLHRCKDIPCETCATLWALVHGAGEELDMQLTRLDATRKATADATEEEK